MPDLTQNDLTVLGVAPNDRKVLENMGLTTLEQLAILNYYKLGLGKNKGRAIIQRARNILLNRHLKGIDIQKDLVIVTVDQEVTEALKISVINVMDAWTGERGNCRVEVSDNKVKIFNSFNPDAITPFSTIVENAKKEQIRIQGKKRYEFIKNGITIEREEIIRFARERGFKGFCENVFSDVIGGQILKNALAIALFSTFEEPNHVLVVGDPASGKSFAKEIIVRDFENVSNVGGMSTKAGLVMNMSTGQLGVLAYSDRKVVLVDEFDKIPKQDVQYILELLWGGKCSVHSARVHEDIESHFIMIALANPKSGAFRGSPMEEINLPPELISRFSLVIKAPILCEDDRKEVFRKKLFGTSEIQKLPEQYNQWVRLASLHKPKRKASKQKVEDYIENANKLITRYYDTKLQRDLRMTDYAKRIPESIARAEFGNVTDETLNSALRIIKQSIDEWDSHQG